MNKLFATLIEWAITSFLLPFIAKIKDANKLLEIKKKAEESAGKLNDAESSSDIDASIDNLP